MLTNQKPTIKIPQSYYCSITSQIMMEPVITADGHTYEREAIEEWLQTHDTSPKTGAKLKSKELTPNWDKKGDIEEFLQEHPELYDGNDVYIPKAAIRELATAIGGNRLRTVQTLLTGNRRLLTAKLDGERTAFHLASEFGSPELTDFLLEEVRKSQQLPKIMARPADFKPIHLNVLLQQALEQRLPPKISLLLEVGADLEQPETSTGNTLLHRLTIQGHPEPVSWLLERNASLVTCNLEGNTALLLAVIHKHSGLTERFIKKGASIQVRNVKQQTPVSIALINHDQPTLTLLIGTDRAALPPLHLALELNDNELLQTLLTHKVGAIEGTNRQQTVLYAAVARGALEPARILLTNGANPNAICSEAQLAPLHIAVTHGDAPMLTLLLAQQAVLAAIDTPNSTGDTALHIAVSSGQDSAIPLLLEKGAWHKAKNQQGQTPIELARLQSKPQIANLIEQKAHTLKQAKLAEIITLRQAAREQAARIEQLEKTLQEHQPILTKFRSDQERTERALKERQEQARNAPRPQELPAFLRLVAEGQQDQAEAMLRTTPNLALIPGDVTDLSNRRFQGITAFQYAAWALDWHMWKMLLKYLPPDAARTQAQGFTTGSWVSQHGVHASWQNLIDALKTYIDNCGKWTTSEQYTNHWIHQVGGAQLLLPAHVIHEYCRPDRSFEPCPTFIEDTLPRTTKLDGGNELNRSELGTSYGLLRYNFPGGGTVSCVPSSVSRVRASDHRSCVSLLSIRTRQHDELAAELTQNAHLKTRP